MVRTNKCVLWFNPSWQLSTTQPFAHPTSLGEDQKDKSDKVVGWDKNSLIIKRYFLKWYFFLSKKNKKTKTEQKGKAKKNQAVQMKAIAQHQLASAQPFPATPGHQPPLYCWAWGHMLWNILWVTWGQLSWLLLFLTSCAPLAPLCQGERQKRLWCCVSPVKASVCYQHCFATHPKHCPIPATVKNITLSQTQPVQCFFIFLGFAWVVQNRELVNVASHLGYTHCN